MSETEFHVGTLIKIPRLSSMSLEEHAKDICIENKVPFDDSYDDYTQILRAGESNDFVILLDEIYKIVDKEFDPDNIQEMDIIDDNTINYMVSFYNGGGSFEEVLEYNLKNKFPQS